MFWLSINGGWVGPFASKKSALDAYRSIVASTRIYKAALYTGNAMEAQQFEYTIV